MFLKKLNPSLLFQLEKQAFNTPTKLQESLIPKVKSGSSVIAIGEKDSGKTTGLIISVLQKLKMQASGDNPRALIFVKDKKEALALEEKFNQFVNDTDLRICTVYEERAINQQKDEVYLGTDIVIGTAKRLSKLYFLNGLNLMELELIAIEDAAFLVGTSLHTDIHRIGQSVKKCQYLILAEKMDQKIEQLRHLLAPNAVIIE